MNVNQLYRFELAKGTPPRLNQLRAAELFECGQCRFIHRDRVRAEKCCICDVCNKPQDPLGGYPYHAECSRIKDEQRNFADIERAEKLENWDGPVIYDGEFYLDIESFVNRWPRSKSLPQWVFATNAESFPSVSYDQIEERLCDEGYEDMRDDISGSAALIAAIDVFNDANKSMVTHWEDRTQVVRVPEVKNNDEN